MIAAVPIPPAPAYFVTDTAHVLSAETQAHVEDELEAFARRTTDQVVVYIGESTGDTPLETWTVKAAQAWHVGQRGQDNGAVLFLFIKDRRVRIEVGYGLEATLTDAAAAAIERDAVEPAMRSGNVDRAVTGGVDEMLKAIDTGAAPPVRSTSADFSRSSGSGIGFFGHLLRFISFWMKMIIGVPLVLAVVFVFFYGIFDWIKTGKRDPAFTDAFGISVDPMAYAKPVDPKYANPKKKPSDSGAFTGGGAARHW